ncbi:MAG: glycogen/starch synthase, partial [Pseudomonadota bacterium]
MAAAENGALPRGKVGGVADVVRDLPPALAETGWRTTVLTPEYGLFANIAGATPITSINVAFAGRTLGVDVVELPSIHASVRHLAFAHERFTPQGPGIYCDDGDERPFASDASKFALFAAATATWVSQMDTPPTVVHLHDWHAALYCLLRARDPAFASLQTLHTVYTIHNLALQGIRPLANDESSLAAWYPQLAYRADDVVDPRFNDTINPMATAIRLADGVNTVSPTYANEILKPNDPARGFRGGEGLESVLADVASAGNLVGILNGCEYPKMDRRRPGWRRLLDTIAREVYEWIVSHRGP